jgi:two-component system, sporulation sensor kinase E
VKKFIQKALEKLPKMDTGQIATLIGQLSDQNELLDMVFESMTDGIVVTDGEHRVILYNKSAERLLPTSGDLLDSPLWEAVTHRELAGFLFQKLLGKEKVADREFTLGGSQPRLLSLSLLPLVRAGSVQGSLLHVEDVTEKRAREARLRRAESLASLTTLAAGVAHEIKNPLGSMGIHLQLIRKKTDGKLRVDPRTIANHLQVLGEEVDRLNRIVVDFLFAVKPMDTRLEDGDINAVITEMLAFVRPEMDQAGVRVEAELAEDLPLLRIDARFIRQALLNLIKNAVAAMPEGGVLAVSTVRADGEVLVRVSDTGAGIPEDIMEKIFEPYFTTKPFGTGLGLTIVFKIVKEHFGDISVSSKLGQGTTVTIALPVVTREKILIDYTGGAL